MRIDVRKKINNSFLYKRFAYNSEGFVELMKFLERENIIDDFCNECNFKRPSLANDLEFDKKNITLWDFFSECSYSFNFVKSWKGFKFWDEKIFYNNNFREIRNKLL